MIMKFREIKFKFKLDNSVLNDDYRNNKYDIFLSRHRTIVVNLILFLLPISLRNKYFGA